MLEQLVIPQKLISLVLYPCHDHTLSGDHLAFKPTFGKIPSRFLRLALIRAVQASCQDCQSCDRRNALHHRAASPLGGMPVEHSYQRMLVEMVEYKTTSTTPDGVRCEYVSFILNHLARFPLSCAAPNQSSKTVARVLIEGVFGVFGSQKHCIRTNVLSL